MWEFISQNWWIIVFAVIMILMHRSGMGCCGGGHQHGQKRGKHEHGSQGSAGMGCCGGGHQHGSRQSEHEHSPQDTTGLANSGQKIVLSVEGMTCMNCKLTIEKALKNVEGVETVTVDLSNKEVVITGTAARDRLIKAVEAAGYPVKG